MHRVPFKYSPEESGYALSREQILHLIDDYAQAAYRAQRAGADGIEIHGAHGYLVSHFLSPATNWRTDEYGGDVHGRALFAQQIIRRTRELCGPDFVIGIRINGNDYVKGGINPAMAASYAGLMEEAGADYISVTAGFYGSFPASILPMGEPPGIFVHLAAKVREAVGIPVITAGRINDPRLAEQILREGRADLVGMTRALMADPEMPQKARKGVFQQIRKCVGCLACVDRMIYTGLRCLVNPEVGREGLVPIEKAKEAKNVLVIGGGPAGLKAAETALLRGHNVIVYEKAPFLGGKLRYAAMIATRQEMLEPVKYLEYRLHELGARIEWDEADTETVRNINPDVVVVATGAKPLVPRKPYPDGPSVYHAVDIFAQEAEVGVRVLVIGSSLISLQTCDWLAERGKEVTLISKNKSLLPEFYGVTLYYIRNRFGLLDVKILKPACIEKVEGQEVVVNSDGELIKISGVETLVYTDFEPDMELAGEIEKANYRVEVIGSAFQVGLAVDAMEQGFNIGREI
jgi:NADPH-dependent 2,4-dienoyl-CoA reductase/sulfur reductase-like enzyme